MGKPRIKKRSRGRRREKKVDPETMDALEGQLRFFREKFGGEPGPDDPIFFDPDADTPIPMEMERVDAEIVRAMALAGVDPALIYAYHRTGLIVSEDNVHFLSSEDLAEWESAIEEYNCRLKGKPS